MGFNKHFKLNNFLLFCSLLITPITASHAYDFSVGVFKFQQKLAAKGNPQAQYKLANMYENGQGVKTNLNQALIWYTKSAAQNYAPAKIRITYVDIRKNGYKSSKHAKWLKKLILDAENNNGESLFLLASLYKKGFIVRRNYSKAANLFRRASNKNIPGAETELDKVEAILNDQKRKRLSKNKQLKREAEKKRNEQAALERKKSEEEKNKKILLQRVERQRIAAEKERTTSDREKRRLLEENKRSIEKRRSLLLKQAQAEQKVTPVEAIETVEAVEAVEAVKEEPPSPVIEKKKFNKSICKGKKARFLTICR